MLVDWREKENNRDNPGLKGQRLDWGKYWQKVICLELSSVRLIRNMQNQPPWGGVFLWQ